MEPFLSIVIPSNNRMEILIRNIKKILEYENDDIEVVVQDNCSKEPIEEAINGLNDRRVKFYRNYSNIGIDSFYYALKSATGTYSWLISYRDEITKNDIIKCIELLNESKPDLLFVSGENCEKYEDGICNGFAAICKYYAGVMYGTGIIYKHSKINFKKYESNLGYDVWNQYPQMFLANDIIKVGKVETSSLKLFKRYDYYTDNKLTWFDKDRPFYPEIPARMHLLKCCINDLLIDDSCRLDIYPILLLLRFVRWEIAYIDFIKNLEKNKVFSSNLKKILYQRFVDFRTISYICYFNEAKKIINSLIGNGFKISFTKLMLQIKLIKSILSLLIELIILDNVKSYVKLQLKILEK